MAGRKPLGKPPAVYEIELRERMVRVEEELRHQRELMREGFAQMDQRHQELRQDVAARFEQVDQRFEALTRRIDRFRIWSFGTTAGVGGLVVTLDQVLASLSGRFRRLKCAPERRWGVPPPLSWRAGSDAGVALQDPCIRVIARPGLGL